MQHKTPTYIADEGYCEDIYKDSRGLKTFGIGHLILKEDEESDEPVGTLVDKGRIEEVFLQDLKVCGQYIVSP